jgi:soluble lytic murein transglycosylase-like protein
MGLLRGRNALGAHSLALAAGLVAGLPTVAGTGAASAQVIQVGPEGVTVRTGPAVLTPDGAQPIRIERPAPAPNLSDVAAARHRRAEPLFRMAGETVELSPRLLEAVAYVESRFNHAAVSPKGAIGLMQLMPATARDLGVDPADPSGNARGGATYLRQMLVMFDGDLEKALAAYNAGPSAVKRHGGVPPFAETRAYVAAVMDYLAETSVTEDGR